MKRLRAGRAAVVSASVGVILMILTIAWRINPAEGSVVPGYLLDNTVGLIVFWTLFVTCMPAWIGSVYLAEILPLVNPDTESGWRVTCGIMCVLQFLLYFGLGHLGSRMVRRVKRRYSPVSKSPEDKASER